MPAPKGNQYGKLAITSGRPRKFKTPEELQAAADTYFKYQDEHPKYKMEMLKKPVWVDDLVDGGGEWIYYVPVPIKNPYLISGLCLFIGTNTEYFKEFEDSLDLRVEIDKEFSRVIRAIKDRINQDQVTGGLNGTLNPMLVARIQRISEIKETETTAKITFDNIDYDALDDETLEKLVKAKKK